jgi:hypothetical protein
MAVAMRIPYHRIASGPISNATGPGELHTITTTPDPHEDVDREDRSREALHAESDEHSPYYAVPHATVSMKTTDFLPIERRFY